MRSIGEIGLKANYRQSLLQALALALLCVVTYACSLDNGFIADDYTNIESAVKTGWRSVLGTAPENFRLTSYLAYAWLERVFDGRYALFYAANITLHFFNCLLLWKVLLVLGRPDKEAYLAAALFAVFQAPQEAVMWIAAMNETLLAFFGLSTLVLWLKSRFYLSTVVFLLALFSKESALILLLVLILIRYERRQQILTLDLVPLLVPVLVFGSVFLWTWSRNSMIQYNLYHFSPRAGLVAARSLHLLFRPSFYVLFPALMLTRKQWRLFLALPKFVFWIIIPMLPYIFLLYSPYVPSRQVYLASMVVTSVMAFLLGQIPHRTIQSGLVSLLIVYNVAYTWIRNDQQFENRAAPTTQLLALLKSHQPAPILIERFPYAYSGIAKAVSRYAPGWSRDDIHVNEDAESCHECVIFSWDAESKTYVGHW